MKRCSVFDNAFFLKIRNSKVKLEKAKKNQNEFKADTKRVENKPNEQTIALYNIETLYKAQEKGLNFLMIILPWYPRLISNNLWRRTQNINS